ncbi:Aldo/keto reductase [Aspergillus heteromorphus CBS 117.55]|uniref:D-xylose reductase [NAD(P)H] n=1 Tax=Aspergillus heteromorphus CBS 117.55 TaxID=1448321 RepID=A0A317WVY3_9EURO|nr:Aldo/keto reductase [Aspergillus heteromorphus CBS 117.55]PWY90021.1 Aldo/keto reductase [Aspergillus heteromorphus CBS 117.55]
MHFPHAYRAGPDNSTFRHSNGKPVIDHLLSRDYPSTWAAMERLVDNGKARSIGVSNFNVLKLKRLLETARIPPAVNQVELHPYLPQSALVKFCNQNGIHVMAHQPLGGKPVAVVSPNADRPGPLDDSDKIAKIGAKYRKSPAQVILSWIVQQNISVIPKTVHGSRMLENRDLQKLSDEDMIEISNLSKVKGEVRYLDPRNHIGFDIFDEGHDEPVHGE